MTNDLIVKNPKSEQDIKNDLLLAGWHEVGSGITDSTLWYHPHVFGGHKPKSAQKIVQDNPEFYSDKVGQ